MLLGPTQGTSVRKATVTVIPGAVLRHSYAWRRCAHSFQVFVTEQLVRQNLREEHLQGVPDLQRIVRKFDGDRANLEDVYKYYTFAQTLQPILVRSCTTDAAAAFTLAYALCRECLQPLFLTHLHRYLERRMQPRGCAHPPP
jgi:DNA mismatch repair ATPase MutS